MIYVFHLKVLAACEVLSKAVDTSRDPSMFRIAAIALSSFNADRTSTAWRNQRSVANMQIQDPHIRAIFSFLIADNDNFDLVLVNKMWIQLILQDFILILQFITDGGRYITG